MTEDFLQFIWQFSLIENNKTQALTGEEIEIINPGSKNIHAGPDFFNARIKINNIEWAGNVEIHIKSSDWIKHNHHNDSLYNNVILHVVYENDTDLSNDVLKQIPIILLKFNKSYLNQYSELVENKTGIACSGKTQAIEPFRVKTYLTSLAVDRLQKKALSISEILRQNQNNWEETLYQVIAKNFGFQVNSQPFEMLARSIPLSALSRQKNNLLQIEALLLGQSGLLQNANNNDTYVKDLIREYNNLKVKYFLRPLDYKIWRFMRVRPLNFPTLRIAQLAKLIHKSHPLFVKIIESSSPKELESVFNIEASDFWNNYYDFDSPSKIAVKKLGKVAYNYIVINTIAPFLFLFGKMKDEESFIDKSLAMLESIEAENNHIIKLWQETGINPINALESQALIHLHNEYCNKRKCIDCSIGCYLITKTSQ